MLPTTITPLMNRFLHGHATHPDWRMALAHRRQRRSKRSGAEPGAAAAQPTLGWAYLTDAYAPHATALLAELHAALAGGRVGRCERRSASPPVASNTSSSRPSR